MTASRRLFMVMLFFLCWTGFQAIEGRAEPLSKSYDECVFIISNFSGVDATLTETRTIGELLNENVGGFRFQIDWEKVSNRLMLKTGSGNSVPLSEVFNQIRQALEKDTDRVLTLFLDFNVNVNELITEFEKSGLMDFVYKHKPDNGWLSLHELIRTHQRLVVFSMQEHRTSPDWLNYIWNFAVEPYFSLVDAPDFIGDFLKGDPKNDLLIYNDYNIQGPVGNDRIRNFNLGQNPYLIEHLKNVWAKTGKTPNFIMLDRFEPRLRSVIDYLNIFKTLKGSVTYNTQPLNYVSWEGRNSLTNGKFCFPIGPGDNVTLTPRSPGYRFKPESVSFGELNESKEQYFIAIPLDINDNLEAYYNLNGDGNDLSNHNLDGVLRNVSFLKDSIRQTVAFFNERSQIDLTKAEEFKLRDHDFTISAWIKIKKFLNGKQDYCILGTPTSSYQEGIHLVIRDRKPYFGFYSNDLEGNMTFEEGKWYYVVWRYTKLTGEQAIYVNGKLDSRSLGHPSYKGKDKLIVGIAGYSDKSNMYGCIDDLVIWSRALGNEEIWGLSKGIIELSPYQGIWHSKMIVLIAFLVVLLMGLLILWAIRRQKRPISESPVLAVVQEAERDKVSTNSIYIFGEFKILDKTGEDISAHFTPKLKQLFLIILVWSQHYKKGISTKELTEILWPGYSYQNAKNIRGVTIRKLRLLLESLDTVEIVFHIDTWSMTFSENVYCDYVACLKLVEFGNTKNNQFYSEFFRIVRRGEVFFGESHDWLDDSKGFIVNNVVDHLIKYIQLLNPDKELEFILKLSDRILLADPVNDIALKYKLRTLMKQNNHKTARSTYDKFFALYQEMYGEKFAISFDKLIGSH